MPKLSAAVFLVLLSLTGVTPAAAQSGVVWSGHVTEPTWIAVSFDVEPGGVALVDVSYDDAVTDKNWLRMSSHAVVNGESMGSYMRSIGCPTRLDNVEVSATAGDTSYVDFSNYGGCDGSSAVVFRFVEGTVDLVIMFASDGTFTMNPLIRVFGDVVDPVVSTGQAFYEENEEFAGGLNVHAEQGRVAGGHALVNGSISKFAESSMFAWFVADGYGANHVDGPTRRYDNPWSLSNAPPGDYEFVVDLSANIAPGWSSDVMLLGADVTLPRRG